MRRVRASGCAGVAEKSRKVLGHTEKERDSLHEKRSLLLKIGRRHAGACEEKVNKAGIGAEERTPIKGSPR